MPELPDLAVYCDNLKKLVLDKTIERVWLSRPSKITDPFFADKLTGERLTDIARHGKELFFSVSSDGAQRSPHQGILASSIPNKFSVHLMLHGMIDVLDGKAAEAAKGKLLILHFADRQAMVIADKMKQCKISVNPKRPTVPDALSPAFSYEKFKQKALRNALTCVKVFLLDQKVVRGIGNAYADEILWRAGISPVSILSKTWGFSRWPNDYRKHEF